MILSSLQGPAPLPYSQANRTIFAAAVGMDYIRSARLNDNIGYAPPGE